MEDLYYRKVWTWEGTTGKPSMVEGFVRGQTVFGGVVPCMFDGPTRCSLPPPGGTHYVFERWWRWSPSTWGAGGSWVFAAEGDNWT